MPPGSALHGRDVLLAQVLAWCRNHDGPLLTLWGPGGVGKTSLARAVCAALGPAERCVFVELQDCPTVDAAARAVASALDPSAAAWASDTASASACRALAAAGPCLLLLDNLEHLTPEAAAWVVQLGDAAPEATLLVTSRVTLGLQREFAVEVAPLSDDDARGLLRARVGAASADETGWGPLLGLLGGLPLALELAAVRLRRVPAPVLTEALREDLRALDSEAPDRPPRQRSLSRVLASSLALLKPEARRALWLCAQAPAPLRVVDVANLLGQRGPEALALLEGLVGASLMRTAGERFTVPAPLAPLCDASACGVDDDDAAALRQRTAWHLVARAEAADGTLERNALPFVATTAADPACVLAAAARLSWRSVTADVLDALAARVLGSVEAVQGHDAAANPPGPSSPADAARALVGLSEAAWRVGRLDQASAWADRAAQHPAADDDTLALAALARARIAFTRGALDDADRHARRAAESPAKAPAQGAVAHARALTAALALHVQGSVALAQARRDAAEATFLDVRDRARALSQSDLEAHTEASLGMLLLDQGNVLAARHHLGTARRLAERSGQGRTRDVVCAYGALAAAEDGADSEALLLIDEAIAGAWQSGNGLNAGVFQAFAAALCAWQGQIDEATARLAQADVTEPAWVPVRALCAAFVDLARAHEARRSGDHADAERELVRVDEREADARALAPGSDDLRILLRLLARARSRITPAKVGLPQAVVVIGPQLAWLSVNGGDRTPLQRRPLLRALVGALVDARRAAPGKSVSLAMLAAAAWPHEKYQPAVHHNRLHVALTSLRALGLRDVLVRSSDGYLLDAHTRVESIDATLAPS